MASIAVPYLGCCRNHVRDQITKITDEIGRLLEVQTELFTKKAFPNLASEEMDSAYQARGDRIRQLCSELSDLHA